MYTKNFSEIWYSSTDELLLYARDYPTSTTSNLPPVLCLHGLASSSVAFLSLATVLNSHQHRVILADQRGRGHSAYDPNPDNYILDTYVRDMFKLLDNQGLNRVFIIGTSMGGLIAMLMTHMQPQRIAGIVINDVGPEINFTGIARIVDNQQRFQPLPSWDLAVAKVKAHYYSKFPNFSDSDWLELTHDIYHDVNGLPVINCDPNILQPLLSPTFSANPLDLWEIFRTITVPMLLFHAEKSDILSRDCVLKMQAVQPTMTTVTVPDSGHAPTLNEPVTQAAILSFLQSQSCDNPSYVTSSA